MFQFDPFKVTFHAVSRYAERILGVELETYAVGREKAEAYAAAAGLSVGEIQALIYTPAAAAAIAMGAEEFTIGNATLRACDGRIITVMPRILPKTRSDRRLRVLTEAENRLWVAKHIRRLNGRRGNLPTATGN
jgi:hypothetical protein